MVDERIFLYSILVIVLLFLIFASSWWMWIGGGALNARLLSESIPGYIFLSSYAIKNYWNRFMKAFIFLSFILSFYMNFLTTYQLEKIWWDKYLLPGEAMFNRNAWFANPFLAKYMFENNYIHLTKIYRRGDELIERKIVYRPSLVYKKIVKLFDNEEVILKIK